MPAVVGENVKFATTCAEMAATLTVRELAADCPTLLLTLSVTAYVPARAYRCVTVMPTAVPPVTVDVEALKDTTSLRPGMGGENVMRATVGPDGGKSATLNVTYVGEFAESVIVCVVETTPVFVSFAEKVTSDCGVGATPF